MPATFSVPSPQPSEAIYHHKWESSCPAVLKDLIKIFGESSLESLTLLKLTNIEGILGCFRKVILFKRHKGNTHMNIIPCYSRLQ